MPRSTEAQFEALVSRIEDPAIRALFTWPFLAATELFDELVDAASWELLEGLGALPPPAGQEPEALARTRGYPARALPVVRFLHGKLAGSGHLREEGGRYFPGVPPGRGSASLAEELASRFPSAAVGTEAVRLLLDEAPAFFSGERSGEEILFAPNRLPLWFRYFSNDNLLYEINNSLGAEALASGLPASPAAILEIGGGCGSAAERVLARLGPRVARYLFTEIVPTFLRRGERAARAAAAPGTAVHAARLDMTKPWSEQGVEPGAFDAVYAVNCFHVAPDLGRVLAEAEAALSPGGVLVLSECVRPLSAAQPVYVEFLFDFLESFTGVATDPDGRPTHGFLTASAWRTSLARAGFGRVTLVPDVESLARAYDRFFVAAVVARKGAP